MKHVQTDVIIPTVSQTTSSLIVSESATRPVTRWIRLELERWPSTWVSLTPAHKSRQLHSAPSVQVTTTLARFYIILPVIDVFPFLLSAIHFPHDSQTNERGFYLMLQMDFNFKLNSIARFSSLKHRFRPTLYAKISHCEHTIYAYFLCVSVCVYKLHICTYVYSQCICTLKYLKV